MGSVARSTCYPAQEHQSFGRSMPAPRPYVVVVFGRTGVGISSLVNLIAGHPASNVHSDAKTSIPKIKPYSPVKFHGSEKQFSLYELPGFCGQLPDKMIMQAIHHIEQQEGIDLFVYCLRSQKTTVISKIVHQIRDEFSNVPMAAVVTELERFKGSGVDPDVGTDIVSMEAWWDTSLEEGGTNGSEIERMCFGRHDSNGFDVHACITTLPPKDVDLVKPLRKRRDESEDCIRQLILGQCDGHKRQPSDPLEPPRDCLSALFCRMSLRF